MVNPSFEADDVIPGNFRVFVPTGWEIYDPENIVDQSNDAVGGIDPAGTTFFLSVPDGQRAGIVYLGADSGTGQEAGLMQTLNANLEPHVQYRLTAAVGNIASGTGLPPSDVYGYFNLAGFPGYRVELLAGGEAIAEDDNSLYGSIPEGEFRLATVAFMATSSHVRLGQPLGIRLINLNLPGTAEEPGIEVDFDAIRLTREPATAPRLTLTRETEADVLTWEEVQSISFRLEYAAALGSPVNWHAVTNAVQTNGSTRVVSSPRGEGVQQRYYRLRSLE